MVVGKHCLWHGIEVESLALGLVESNACFSQDYCVQLGRELAHEEHLVVGLGRYNVLQYKSEGDIVETVNTYECAIVRLDMVVA